MGKPSVPPDPWYMMPWNAVNGLIGAAQVMYAAADILLNEGVDEDECYPSPDVMARPESAKRSRARMQPAQKVGAAAAEVIVDEICSYRLLDSGALRERFAGAIANTNIPPKSRFYTWLGEGSGLIPVGWDFPSFGGTFRSVSLDFLVRNDSADAYAANTVRRAAEFLFRRKYPELMLGPDAGLCAGVMKESGFPFSVMGTITEHEDNENYAVTIKRPFIIVPCTKHRDLLARLESANVTYTKEPASYGHFFIA